jgi:predicted phosphodiesterase
MENSKNINNNARILVLGDNHGKYDKLFKKLDDLEINNCTLIHLGDGGEGFLPHKKQMRQFEHLNECFKKRDIQYLSIRGNHSDPAYFNGSINLSNFKLLPDYTYLTLNDKKFGFVGGAVSIDRRMRAEGISYWKNEKFVLDHSKIERCDVLITHSAPSWNGPCDKAGIAHWCDRDVTLWDECVQERKEHDILLKLCGASHHFAGHFHCCFSVDFDGCVSTILDELEIKEIR